MVHAKYQDFCMFANPMEVLNRLLIQKTNINNFLLIVESMSIKEKGKVIANAYSISLDKSLLHYRLYDSYNKKGTTITQMGRRNWMIPITSFQVIEIVNQVTTTTLKHKTGKSSAEKFLGYTQ